MGNYKLKNYFQMRTFAIAALVAAASAQTQMSDEQIAMYTEDIMNWVASTDYMLTLEETAAAITDKQTARYWALAEEMPGVCEDGQICRDVAQEDAWNAIKLEWEATLMNVRDEIYNARLRTNVHVENGYSDATDCDAGCPDECELREVEYTNIIREQEEIMLQITILEQQKDVITTTQIELIEECPEFVEL